MQDIEATVVNGNGTETGQVITTAIGGRDGQPKQVILLSIVFPCVQWLLFPSSFWSLILMLWILKVLFVIFIIIYYLLLMCLDCLACALLGIRCGEYYICILIYFDFLFGLFIWTRVLQNSKCHWTCCAPRKCNLVLIFGPKFNLASMLISGFEGRWSKPHPAWLDYYWFPKIFLYI